MQTTRSTFAADPARLDSRPTDRPTNGPTKRRALRALTLTAAAAAAL